VNRHCSVLGCYEPMKARHLCAPHYDSWMHGRAIPEHDKTAGELRDDPNTPSVCVCNLPEPDAIGECALCGRPYKASLRHVRLAWQLYLSGDKGKESDEQFQDQ
jgi:hypothetical protein